MTTPLELLAPAPDADIGIAAIDHGADAVYIGAPKFSARAAAGNRLPDIDRLIRYAHLFYAKVYVALNTLLTDSEIPEALKIIRSVFEAGADGLILQDVGLLELDLPPIPLIASTQMHNSTVEKVRFLEAVGFTRVILARELSVDEIARIRSETRIELESFVHGALCVSYSGQCYMSQVVAHRSGNRGVCAQPCRSRYTLRDGDDRVVLNEKFLLSLKDLNRIEYISALTAAGVTSFKIEGRYKDIDYVKNITAAYRRAIDRHLTGNAEYRRASSGTGIPTFSPDPERTFNRGYTPYFLFGRSDKIASIDTQKSIGQFVGTISAVGKDFFQIPDNDLQNGDGLCFLTTEKKLSGFRVDRVGKDGIYPNSMRGLRVGTRLHRNHDHAFSRRLKKAAANRKIAVEMTFSADEIGFCLTVTDEDGNQAQHILPTPVEAARNPSGSAEKIRTQLTSTGNTVYQVRRIFLHPEQPGFWALSVLNDARRHVLESLTRIRLERYPRRSVSMIPNTVAYPERELDYRANVLNDHARRFYARHGARVCEPAFETLSETVGKPVMTTRYCLRHQLDACLKSAGAVTSLKEPLHISDGRHTYRLEFDCRQCRMAVILVGTGGIGDPKSNRSRERGNRKA